MQVIRFGAVGGINTLIDFGIFNLLMWMTGISSGSGLVFFNFAAFIVANLNSYAMNKGWTFKYESKGSAGQYFLFLAFSGGGLVVNCGVLYLFTATFPDGASSVLWANGGKLVATVASMIWNFLTYRRFVFAESGGGVGERRRCNLQNHQVRRPRPAAGLLSLPVQRK